MMKWDFPKTTAVVGACLGLLVGCSSSDKSSADGATNVATGDAAVAAGCAKNDLKVLFSPMYSSYDGVHTFQVPAVVNGIDADAVTWSSSDPSMVDLQPDADSGGVMITTRKAGTVTIIASAGGLCGTSLLTIATASPDDWTIGSSRYNDGIVLTRASLGSGRNQPDGGTAKEVACTSCHGDTATTANYKTVAHTPEQTGGFSDDDLKSIITQGTVPTGGYFDANIVSYKDWQNFHRWTMTDEELKGILVYLRALTPQPQTGTGDFGGMFTRGDGGGRNRDGGRRDGGAAEGSDAGASD